MTTDNTGAHAAATAPTATSSAGRAPDTTNDEARVPYRREELAVSTGDQRRDLVRWGAVWSGLLVALATFLLVELTFFSLGWLTLAQGDPDTTAGLVSAAIGLFAFFVGGMIAGGTSIWTGAREGMIHGVLVWALGIVGIIFFTLLGGGALFGSLAGSVAEVSSLQQANLPEVQLADAVDTARSGAGWTALGLVLSLIAAAVGGMMGVKMGSRKSKGSPPATVDVR